MEFGNDINNAQTVTEQKNNASKLLELFPDTFVLHPYYDISNKRGLRYDFLLCPADGKADKAVEGQKINLTVNLDALETKVKEMLSSSQSAVGNRQ